MLKNRFCGFTKIKTFQLLSISLFKVPRLINANMKRQGHQLTACHLAHGGRLVHTHVGNEGCHYHGEGMVSRFARSY